VHRRFSASLRWALRDVRGVWEAGMNPTANAPNPRAWCAHFKGPCAADCYGAECLLREATKSHTTEPGDLAPEREDRMPPGAQLIIAIAAGFILGAIGAALWW